MGTRHLIAIVVDKEIKVAQYNQWDGYPSRAGVAILSILRDGLSDSFKNKVRACSWVTEEDVEIVNATKDWASAFPWLSRDCSEDIFGHIENSENGLKLLDHRNFAAESLFCEWGYVVDLDNSVLEVYSGFNKEPVPAGERFADLEKDGDYYPIRLAKVYDLNSLPDNDTFLSDLNEDGEASE